MKYIVVQLEGKEQIFIFPKEVDHDRMYEAMEAIRFDVPGTFRGNWKRKLREGEAISAGFVGNGLCYGRSETLGLDSRLDVDTALLSKEMTAKADKNEVHILELAMKALTRQMNELLAACTDEKGQPKAPERQVYMQSRACLPEGYSMTLKVDKKEKKK